MNKSNEKVNSVFDRPSHSITLILDFRSELILDIQLEIEGVINILGAQKKI